VTRSSCVWGVGAQRMRVSKKKAPTPMPRLPQEVITPSKPRWTSSLVSHPNRLTAPCRVNGDRDARNPSSVENGLEEVSALRSGCFDCSAKIASALFDHAEADQFAFTDGTLDTRGA
jgi:hypothetical protein